MSNKKFIYAAGVLLVIAVMFDAGYSQPVPVKKVRETNFFGSVADGRYKNEFLGFELEMSAGWVRFDQAETDAAKEIGTEGIKTGDSRYDKTIDYATRVELVVLAYGKKPMGAIENSAIAIGVAKQPTARVTPKMVAEAAKSILLKNTANKLLEDVRLETISGKQFAFFEISLGMYGQHVPLRYYVTMVRDYSLTVSMSYSNAEDLKAMESSLRSIKFNR